MRLLALLLLCASNAQAISISFTSGSGNFQLGDAIAWVDGGYKVSHFSATVSPEVCPSGDLIINEDGIEVIDWIDPVTHVEAWDCQMGLIGGFSSFGFGFNPLTGFFFKLNADDPTPRVASGGHSDLFLYDDGTYTHGIYTHVGLLGSSGLYTVGLPAQSAFTVPEPATLALLALLLIGRAGNFYPVRRDDRINL